MVAGSNTLGTYDTFNYLAAQAEKNLSHLYVERRVAKSTTISRAKAQRRKALPRFRGFLCVFAPLRERFLCTN